MTAPRPVDVSLFGRRAVALGCCSEAQLAQALAQQQALRRAGKSRPLGAILVAMGICTAAQVRSVLAEQGKRPLRCTRCRKAFTVTGAAAEGWPGCPSCGAPLADPPDPQPADDLTPRLTESPWGVLRTPTDADRPAA